MERHILHFIATFSQDLSYVKSEAYLLIAEGITPGFQVTSCARINPRDQGILLSTTYQSSTRTATIRPSVPPPGTLPSGTYCLFVCDTVIGSYPLLDGDTDAPPEEALCGISRLPIR